MKWKHHQCTSSLILGWTVEGQMAAFLDCSWSSLWNKGDHAAVQWCIWLWRTQPLEWDAGRPAWPPHAAQYAVTRVWFYMWLTTHFTFPTMANRNQESCMRAAVPLGMTLLHSAPLKQRTLLMRVGWQQSTADTLLKAPRSSTQAALMVVRRSTSLREAHRRATGRVSPYCKGTL